MRRIKLFENFEENQLKAIEIKEYCIDYLSYLLDEIPDSIVDVNAHDTSGTYKFNFRINRRDNNSYFFWRDIKDSFLPFLEIFMNDYVLVSPVPIGGKPYISFITVDNNNRQGPTITYNLGSVLDNAMDDCVENYNGVCELVKIKMVYFYFKIKE